MTLMIHTFGLKSSRLQNYIQYYLTFDKNGYYAHIYIYNKILKDIPKNVN